MKRSTFIVIFVIVVSVTLGVLIGIVLTDALGDQPFTAYVLCQPSSVTYARSQPSTQFSVEDTLHTGDQFQTDGKIINGFIRRVGPEETWVDISCLIFNKPVLDGKWYTVSADYGIFAYDAIDGATGTYLLPGSKVQVVWKSTEWCSTSRGYVKTKYLTKVGE